MVPEIQAAPGVPIPETPIEFVEPVESTEPIEKEVERIKQAWTTNEEGEFLEAVQDRIFGFIKSRGINFYLFVSDGRGNEVFAHKDDWRSKGGHHCNFNAGAEVSYRVELNKRVGKNKAVDVRLLNPPPIPDFEEATVFDWRNRWGFAERKCGCHIHVHMNDVLSDVDSLKVGDRVWLRAEEGTDASGRFRYVARDVEVFQSECEVSTSLA
jgi:cold shock CspA family protein